MRLVIQDDERNVKGVVENYETYDRNYLESSERLLQALLDIDNGLVCPHGYPADGGPRTCGIDHDAPEQQPTRDDMLRLLNHLGVAMRTCLTIFGAKMTEGEYNARAKLCDRAERYALDD